MSPAPDLPLLSDPVRLTALGGVSVFLVVAALWDLLRRRIPNVLTVSMAVMGLGFSFWRGGWIAVGLALGAVVGSVLLLSPLHAKKGVGAGDVKLFAALSAWLSLPLALWGALYTALCGGVLSLLYLAIASKDVRKRVATNLTNAVLIQSMPDLDRDEVRKNPRRHLPYALAIAAGGACAIVLHGWR
jgi:prepilin peptidase CpaA